ncbi:MAG: transglycosylase SLT domain-containing protein [Terriglobales bacterium]
MTWAEIMLAMLPALAPVDASRIASLSVKYAQMHHLPPALVLAISYTESKWGTNTKHPSPKDHGVMGLRVDHDTLPDYQGRERELDDLETNIRLGVEALVYWQGFHRSHCPAPKGLHPWVSHYQWGNKVGTSESGLRVERIVRSLNRARRNHGRAPRTR